MGQVGNRSFGWLAGVCLVATLASPAVAQASQRTVTAETPVEPTPAQKGRAALLDAYLSSDLAMKAVASAYCKPDDHCENLPNLFVLLARFDSAGYKTLIARVAQEDFTAGAVSPEALNATFTFANATIDRAAAWIDDNAAAANLHSSANVMRTMKAVFPQQCVNLLKGAPVAPSREATRAMATPERLRNNIALLQQAIDNRASVAKGELTLALASASEIDDMVGAFFASLPKEQLVGLMRVMTDAPEPNDQLLACDISENLFNYMATLPKKRAGELLRGMSAMTPK